MDIRDILKESADKVTTMLEDLHDMKMDWIGIENDSIECAKKARALADDCDKEAKYARDKIAEIIRIERFLKEGK